MPVVVARDAETAREGAAWFVAFYLVNMGTMYRHALVRHGFGREVEAVLAADAPKFMGSMYVLKVLESPSYRVLRRARAFRAGDVSRRVTQDVLLRPNQTLEEIAFTLEAFGPDAPAPAVTELNRRVLQGRRGVRTRRASRSPADAVVNRLARRR